MTPTDVELAYLAGILDGEGCITIGFRRGGAFRSSGALHASESHHLVLSVLMRHPAPVELFSRFFGGRVTVRVLNGKPISGWRVHSRRAERTLEILLPYLRVKQEQAKLAIFFQRASSLHSRGRRLPPEEIARRRAARREIQKLNGVYHETAAARAEIAALTVES